MIEVEKEEKMEGEAITLMRALMIILIVVLPVLAQSC